MGRKQHTFREEKGLDDTDRSGELSRRKQPEVVQEKRSPLTRGEWNASGQR